LLVFQKHHKNAIWNERTTPLLKTSHFWIHKKFAVSAISNTLSLGIWLSMGCISNSLSKVQNIQYSLLGSVSWKFLQTKSQVVWWLHLWMMFKQYYLYLQCVQYKVQQLWAILFQHEKAEFHTWTSHFIEIKYSQFDKLAKGGDDIKGGLTSFSEQWNLIKIT
jgi:hypothetical protein